MPIAAAIMLGGTVGGCNENGPIRYSEEDDGRTMPMPEKAPMERCYGIAKAGENDGISGPAHKGGDGPGTSSTDWQGNAWTYVKSGRCEDYGTADGTAMPGERKGSLTPLGRDRPDEF